jgi:hypothetical protein
MMMGDQPSDALLPLHRRGRLNNGNPSGDFLAAPRCGARARSGGSCRQPAMRNGRCRFHGGKSTGPRTAEGRERIRRAQLRHGGRTAEMIALRAAAAASARRILALVAGLRALRPARRPAGHEVLRSNFIFSPGETAPRGPGLPSQAGGLALPSGPTGGET